MVKKGVFFVLVIIMIIILLFISGCNKQTPSGVDITPPEGKDGIVIKGFMKNLPPDEIVVPGTLDVSVEVENKGYYDTTVTFVIVGPTALTVPFSNPFQQIFMRGKTSINPIGDYEVISFTAPYINFPSPGTAVYPDVNLMVVACYPYQTTATTSVCVNPNPYSALSGPQPCVPKDTYSLTGGQGGPVGVSRIDQISSKGKVDFWITIENFGEEYNLYDFNSVQNCVMNDITPQISNIVYYQVQLEGVSGYCTPDNYIRLVDGKARIHCSYTIPEVTNYAVQYQLTIYLWYGYRDSVSRQVKFIKTI